MTAKVYGVSLMRLILIVLVSILIVVSSACSYQSRVKRMEDKELCSDLGAHTLYENEEGVRIARQEISRRDIDKEQCSQIANRMMARLTPKYKERLCQHAAEYYIEADYRNYRSTVDKIKRNNFADQECATIIRFYFRRVQASERRKQAIAEALQEFGEEMSRPGTRSNPLIIELQ